jgi:hypothetical protein
LPSKKGAVMPAPLQPQLSPELQQSAAIMSRIVGNALSELNLDEFSEAQRRRLTPIVRDAIATALHAFEHFEGSEKAQQFVAFHCQHVSGEPEQARLLDYYVEFWNDEEELFGR